MREKVTFPADEPVFVTLDFDDGTPQNSKKTGAVQYMYVVDNDVRIMWVDPAVRELIHDTGARAGDQVCITKRKTGWGVELVEEEPHQAPPPPRPGPRQTARQQPAPKNTGNGHAAQQPAQQPQQAPVTRASADLISCFVAAIDAAKEACAYGQRRGMQLEFDAEGIRAMAITLYIQSQENIRKGAARR